MRIPEENEYQSMTFHPYNVMLSLVMTGITMLFVALSVSYVYTRVQNGTPPIQLPYIFIFNTLILLASSASIEWANRAYKTDNTVHYQWALLLTLVLSLVFMIAQFFGWKALFDSNLHLASSNTASYLWLISGVHFMHVVAGLPFLVLFLIVAYRRMKEPVSVLVYFSDPEKELRLRLLTRYWHYLDGLWIYLVLFFMVNYFI